jgi:hypothetical protein
MLRLRNEWRYSDPLEFKRIGLSRGELGDVVMIAVPMDLARVATGERDAPEFLTGGIQTHEVVLVAHGNEERILVDDTAVRPPK